MMPMPPKKTKTTTEITTLDEIWGDFETEYRPFVEWYYDKETENKFCKITFAEDVPEKYVNKWNRTQWKIKVQNDYDEECMLSGGKRLFQTILRYCKENGKKPTEVGEIILWRMGSGFDTKYKIE